MKLVPFPNVFKSLPRPAFSRVLLYSTETLTSTPKLERGNLYKRISPIGDPRVSIVPILDQWIKEGKTVKNRDLKGMITKFKSFKRFTHALEISQWMSDRRYFILSPGDMVVRLDLISKVHGIEQAKKYFDNIPKQYKDSKIYIGLLNCYAHWKSVENAEALMQHMRELGFAGSSVAYNALLNLYLKVGQYEKIDILMDEMKEMGIIPDKFTLRTQLSAYAATSDIDRMETVLQRMEVDPNIIMDWYSYGIAANGYIKAGLIDKALQMLQKLEEMITTNERRFAYDFLLTLYAAAGRKEDLYRIWNLYKSFEKVYNSAYNCMIASLLKLDDITSAEKILEEWESSNTSYDFRVPNLLIAAYCENGLVEKAETFVYKAIEKGEKPYSNTWDRLASGYIKANQMLKAVEAIKAALLARRPGWKPYRDNLSACLVYLKQHGDAEKTEEFVRLLGAPGHMSTDDCDVLLDYIYAYSKETKVEMDGGGSDDDEEKDENAKEAS